MKSKLFAFIFALTAPLAFGHTGVELGPNGGRVLELSKDETLHGEVTLKGDNFHLALLDKNMKPLAPTGALSVTAGDRAKPVKLTVTKQGDHFVFPTVKSGDWVIVQYRPDEKAKPVTARFEFDPSACEKCKEPEWLCKCSPEKK